LKNYEIQIHDAEKDSILRRIDVKGCLDSHTVVDFEKSVHETLKDGDQKKLILDLSDLTYISSAGISALMGLTHELRKDEGELILLKPSEKIYRIFRRLGFTSIFKIVEDDNALQEV